MDEDAKEWHFSNMSIPTFDLYGEHSAFPDLLHCETINDRAALHDWQIAVHRHADLHQFFLLTEGQAKMTVDGVTRMLDMPVMASVPRNAAHGFRFAQGTKGYVITLPVSAFPQIFGSNSRIATRLMGWGVAVADADLCALVQNLAQEHRAQEFGRELALFGIALRLAAAVARRLDGPETHPYAQRMVALDTLIQENLRNRWRVAEYATALGMTPTHLSRVTLRETGLSASRYVERSVFQEARRLLAYTRASTAEIGWMLGFEDASYFSRAFRRHCGMPPNAYRRQFLGD